MKFTAAFEEPYATRPMGTAGPPWMLPAAAEITTNLGVPGADLNNL